VIGRLIGRLAGKSPPQVLLDVSGVGYEVDVPMSSFFNLPALGEQVTLLTHFVVREDAQVLFGFLTPGERETFRQLIRISGVGPRTALSILSTRRRGRIRWPIRAIYSKVSDLAQAVTTQDARRLVKVPGIGKKTAERLLLELKGRLGADLGPSGGATPASDAQADILQALVALGYSERDAHAAVKPLAAGVGVSEGIKQALKSLVR